MSKILAVGGKTVNSKFFLGCYSRTMAIHIGNRNTTSTYISIHRELNHGISILFGCNSKLKPNAINPDYIGTAKWQFGFGFHINPMLQKHSWNKDKFICVTGWPFSDGFC